MNRLGRLLGRLADFFSRHPRRYAVLLAAICSSFAGFISARSVLFNADATSNVFMFQSAFKLHDFRLADWHTSLLKIPILLLQALFPFNPTTFTICVILLIFATIVLWGDAVSRIIGRQLMAPVVVILSLITLASARFATEISMTTARNLEYGLFAYAIVWFWKLVRQIEQQGIRPVLKPAIIYLVLVSVFLASDPYFIYLLVPSLFISLVWHYYHSKLPLKRLLAMAALAVAPAIGYKVILLTVKAIGIYTYNGYNLAPPIYPFLSVVPAFWQAVYDVIIMFDADIFGLRPGFSFAVRAGFLALLAAAVIAYIAELRRPRRAGQSPEYKTLLISLPVMFAVYVLTFSLDRQYRYVDLLVFALPVILLVYLRRQGRAPAFVPPKSVRPFLVLLPFVVILPFAASAFLQYRSLNYFNHAENTKILTSIMQDLYLAGDTAVISEHQYAASIQFLSNGRIQSLPVAYCQTSLPFLVRTSWYRRSYSKTAIVVDRHESPNGYPADNACSLQNIIKTYGKPDSSKTTAGLDGRTVDIYFYDHNLADKIKD